MKKQNITFYMVTFSAFDYKQKKVAFSLASMEDKFGSRLNEMEIGLFILTIAVAGAIKVMKKL